VAIIRERWTRENFLNKIDNCIRTCTKLLNDFKLIGRLEVGMALLLRKRMDLSNNFTLEIESLADNVSRNKDVVDGGVC
jgi:hypothetical protein